MWVCGLVKFREFAKHKFDYRFTLLGSWSAPYPYHVPSPHTLHLAILHRFTNMLCLTFQCGDCNCACNLQMPECNSINCICFEIQLRQPTGVPGPPGNMQGQSGYHGQYPGSNVSYPGQQINYGQQLSFPNPRAWCCDKFYGQIPWRNTLALCISLRKSLAPRGELKHNTTTQIAIYRGWLRKKIWVLRIFLTCNNI